MKLFVKLSQAQSSIEVNNITLNDSYDKIGEGSVHITTLDFENRTRIDEIIDVEGNEKRRRDEVLRRRASSHLQDTMPRTYISPMSSSIATQETAIQDVRNGQRSPISK